MFPPYSTFCWRSERRERNHSQFMTSDISDMSVLSNIILSFPIRLYDSVYSKVRIAPFFPRVQLLGGGGGVAISSHKLCNLASILNQGGNFIWHAMPCAE